MEREAIIAMWRKGPHAHSVLATLIQVEGSSYRRPGARMYIQPTGYAGAISGGCLEGDVIRKAVWMTRNGPTVVRYSTAFDEIAPDDDDTPREIPYGLGCGGVLDVLLEPAELPEGVATLQALEAAQQGRSFRCATLLPFAGNVISRISRVILRDDLPVSSRTDAFFFASEDLDETEQEILQNLASSTENAGVIAVTIHEKERQIYLETLRPPQRVVIFGAGDDVVPLVEMGRLLGWNVTVADGRSWLAQPARFPKAQQVLCLAQDGSNFDDLKLSSADAVAVLTHSFEQDRHLLQRLLPLELRYLGMLGARHRSRLLLSEVAKEIGWTPEECASRVRAPIGLDLGGDSPEAVALAIAGEIQSVLNNKPVAARQTLAEIWPAVSDRTYIPAQCPLDAPPSGSNTDQMTDVEHSIY